MNDNTAGIITSTHECGVTFNWEDELLGASSTESKLLALEERRACGNVHPQQMYTLRPTVSQTIGIVFATELQDGTVKVDDRDTVASVISQPFIRNGKKYRSGGVRRWHITWRATDQYIPGKGMFMAGYVVLRSDGRKQFRTFDGVAIPVPLDAINTYVEGLTSTSY